MIKKYIKIVIENNGGEYCYGVVTNEAEIDCINNIIDEGNIVSLNNYGVDENGDDISVDFFNYEQVLHVYGPALDEASISITSYEDIECTKEIEKILENKTLTYTLTGGTFTTRNPYFDEDQREEYDEDNLIFGGYTNEKNITYPVILELDENEEFNRKNIFIGAINLDETLCGDEIVERIMYLNSNTQEQILKLYLEDKYTVYASLSDYLDEIFAELDSNKEIAKILEKNTLKVGDIEGQGDIKSTYVVIKNMENEILFEE